MRRAAGGGSYDNTAEYGFPELSDVPAPSLLAPSPRAIPLTSTRLHSRRVIRPARGYGDTCQYKHTQQLTSRSEKITLRPKPSRSTFATHPRSSFPSHRTVVKIV
jgi:hypothetical protein